MYDIHCAMHMLTIRLEPHPLTMLCMYDAMHSQHFITKPTDNPAGIHTTSRPHPPTMVLCNTSG